MRAFALAVLLVAVAVIPAGAQTRLSAKQTCAKSDPDYSIDVADQAGHGLMLHKSLCTWDTPLEIEGIKSKDAVDVATSEMRGVNITDNGYSTSTMENGDRFTVHYTGRATAAKDGTATFKGRWTFVGGTGQLKGIKGHGTYKGSGKADGSGTVEIEGGYTLVRAPAKPHTRPATK